ncbi:catalase [Trichonephila inaurata madagascariensis]|uniref:Catalase n=1 Tax=Trichonephila inaurata madagascariensis TaxID=2747483 RepID=A0A8X7CMJ8_9ARAC|nr:catalase [Trichonephila inaurata madagascariensis]
MFWDFLSLRPESTHQVSILFSDRGIPYGYRYMNGYGSNTFKLINAENEAVYCKFIYKVWPQKEFPLIEVGKLVLNRNPKNYFAEVEQIAFSVASLVPGIESSPDKMLQGRLFSYSDTQRYRLGTNFLQLPVNCPYRVRPRNYERDGEMTIQSQDGAPNYYPNSFGGPVNDRTVRQPPYYVAGDVDRYNSENEDNFTQAGIFYREAGRQIPFSASLSLESNTRTALYCLYQYGCEYVSVQMPVPTISSVVN